MADYLTTDIELTSIANAIRAKGGTSEPLTFPSGFVDAIENIPSGGDGGMNKQTFYTDQNGTNLWIDASRTVTVMDYYEWDYEAVSDALQDVDIIYVIPPNVNTKCIAVYWKVDTIDEDFSLTFIIGTKVKNIIL